MIDSGYYGKNAAYYQAQYEMHKASGSSSFNWAAFLFQGWWFLYRKLYLLALIFWVASYIPGVGLVTAIIAGLIANKSYFEDAEKKLSFEDRSAAGVNEWVPILGIAASVIAFALITFAMLAFFASAAFMTIESGF